ncbi:MAG: hypothetical protein WAK26_00745, partial [Terracidiphilus sp.]
PLIQPLRQKHSCSPFSLGIESCTNPASPGAEKTKAPTSELCKSLPPPPVAGYGTESLSANTTAPLATEIFESASELAQLLRATGPLAKRLLLLGPRTATLNQDNQDNDNQHTCNNPDYHGSVHAIPLS